VYGVPGKRQEVQSMRVLIVGCGNSSRRDDGIGLYVVQALSRRFGLPEFDPSTEERLTGEVAGAAGPVSVDLRFEQQLDISLGAELADFDLFIVVDAHTGTYQEPLRRAEADPGYSPSLTSHHLTADTLAGVSLALNGKAPRSLVYSARGYDFNFGTELSPETVAAADEAVEEIAGLVMGPSA
jgi:hydrogenase maturation protease